MYGNRAGASPAPTGSEYHKQGLREPGRPPVAPTRFGLIQSCLWETGHTWVRPYHIELSQTFFAPFRAVHGPLQVSIT
ncbi:hypothetical protein [Xanthocytophaga flava]|uniref:hypothetical protein n=1 Tax=Xanthocytophaga flava TaxID=3048013 RepID=UPI0028D3FE69|nr:hypothetical protein [Xanthocytophaga flavus]MDJ1473093.1 hypothetical protein [Xanthocytophaga flavus]